MKKYARFLLVVLFLCTAFVLSNPNCPTGKTGAPSLSTGSVSNCTSCHGDYSVNSGGGGIVISGLPSVYTPGSSYTFSIKINHPTTDRKVWGYAIKAIDTVTRAVVGTWTTTNTNSSIKGTAGGSSYELSHANAATTSAGANTYTYNNLTWTAPSTPTINQAKVKFYIAVVSGDNNGNEAGDYVYTTTFTSNQQVVTPACTFTYGQWTTCSGGVQTRSYTSSPAGCTGTPPADSIQRTCTVPQTLPTAQVITQAVVPGVCDTIRTFTVPIQSGVYYAWSVAGAGNFIVDGQGTNSIRVITKVAGSATVTLSNSVGSIPSVSSTFTRALPPTPTAINGSVTPCSSSSFTYTLTVPTPSATQVAPVVYRWTIPANSSITSASADSSSVTIAYGATFNGGNITAKSQSACNIWSGTKILAVAPPKPLDIVSSTGFYNACIGSSMILAVVSAIPTAGIPTGSIYRWTKPVGTAILSSNADSSVITLSFITGYKGGAIKVQSATSCGTLGVAASRTLTHINCAPGSRPDVEVMTEDMVSVSPNPNNGTFRLRVQTENKTNGTSLVRVFDYTGKMVAQRNAQKVAGLIDENFSLTLTRGTYIVTYIVGDTLKSVKMYVTH